MSLSDQIYRQLIHMDYLYVTRHEKIGLICTKYTSSHYPMYLNIWVRYLSSVNCRTFSIVWYTSCKSFIDKLYLGTKWSYFKFQKVGKFYVHISPIFSSQVTYVIDVMLALSYIYVLGEHPHSHLPYLYNMQCNVGIEIQKNWLMVLAMFLMQWWY